MKPRFLTKSRFIKANDCPRKIFYEDHPNEYENKTLDNPFLRALSDGGFQVGALARVYHPGGLEFDSSDHRKAAALTGEHLKKDNVTIYEAPFAFENFFVRVDVLVKSGNNVELIEVKAKSYDRHSDEFFDKRLLKKGAYKLTERWKKYLYDVAFQTLVCRKAFPEYTFTPFMMFADKNATASVDGLNQRFLLLEENGRLKVKVAPGTDPTAVGDKLLCKVNVSDVVDKIINGMDLGEKSRAQLGLPSFEDVAKLWADSYQRDERLEADHGSHCKTCEFRTHSENGKQNGFDECWKEKVGDKINEPFVFDVWNFRKSESLIGQGKFLMSQIEETDIEPESDEKPGLSVSERQWLQVKVFKAGEQKPQVSLDALKAEMATWKYPLHFIDFETATVAIPFNKGRSPYEQIAFQFSHHVVHQDGRVEHAGQYINDRRGAFPNFEFIRALKSELQKDNGTIFRYAHHENTVLCQIFNQLKASAEPDKETLMAWIRTVTTSTESTGEDWAGARAMVDLWAHVKRFYYHPFMKGSNSLKQVLPAILKESVYLQEKYALPAYGASNGIKSLNYKDWTWLKRNPKGEIIDPYKQLPKIFDGVDMSQLDFTLMRGDELADGGAASTAYAKMQFTEMNFIERTALKDALLKYCELDTLAMVMLYEHWMEITGKLKAQRVA